MNVDRDPYIAHVIALTVESCGKRSKLPPLILTFHSRETLGDHRDNILRARKGFLHFRA